MGYRSERARQEKCTAAQQLKNKFREVGCSGGISAQYVRFGTKPVVIGISGLKFDSMLISVIAEDNEVFAKLSECAANGYSVMFINEGDKVRAVSEKDGVVSPAELSDTILETVKAAVAASEEWGGKLNETGELILDPATPSPGPHYYTNMLIGNRIGFDHPLQSTPKSAIDRMGGGSFRSHADKQVLATRWDYLPDENGFPANRQFYLAENGKQIFWSGAAKAEGLKKVTTVHSQNRTVISYELDGGLEVKRTIFIVP